MTMFAAPLAGRLARRGVRAAAGRLRRRRRGAAPAKRRQRRIVFSENQWNFVRSLMRATTGRSLPGVQRRRRRTRRPFGG